MRLAQSFTIHFPFVESYENIRFPGVLQRIGLVFFFAAVLFLNFNWKSLLAICVLLLLGYWVWLGFIPIQGEAPTFARAPNNWANYIDLKLLGTHMYKPDYDPEGVLSTIPSVASSLLGIFTGLVLVSKHKNKGSLMVLMGIAMVILGYIWNSVFPINKPIWTSSYVLVTAGWANLFLALIYYLTDVRGIQFGSIFRYAGSNAITVYFLSSWVTKIFYEIEVNPGISLHQWMFENIFVNEVMPLKFSSLLYALCVIAFYLLLAYIMYRKKIFIKV